MLKPDSQVSRIGTVRRVALELLGPCRKSEAPAKAKRKETKEKDDRCTATLQKLWLFKDLGDSNMSKQQVLQN